MTKSHLHDGDCERPPASDTAILHPSAPSGGESGACLNEVPHHPHSPSHEEAEALPTSFKLLFGPAGVFDIWGKLSNSIIHTTSLLGALGIMAGMVGVGAYFFHDCTVEPKIPIMLIVGGVHVLIAFIVNCVDKRSSMNTDAEHPGILGHKKSHLSRFLSFLFLIWIVTLSYWVYSAFKPSFNSEDADFCNEILYWSSFWLLNVTYSIMVLFCMCSVVR